MNELKEKLTSAISGGSRSVDIIEKCEEISRAHTIKVLESLLTLRGSSPDRFYIGIAKAQMAVKTKEV